MKKVNKVWGHEEIIVNQQAYCGKRLILKSDYQSSIHMHPIKDETFYFSRGITKLEIGRNPDNLETKLMKKGDVQRVEPRTWHRFTGLADAVIFEFSTHHKEQDVKRKTSSQKADIKVGYDYDGVASTGIDLKPGAPIITGRSYQEAYSKKLARDLILKGHPVYWCPVPYSKKSDKAASTWKGKMIKRLKLEKFYEDNPSQIEDLNKICPNCHIQKVGFKL